MNILFLGLQYNKNNESEYLKLSKTGLQSAANTYQWNLVDGLNKNGCNITIINCLPVGTFPFYYKRLFLKSYQWEYEKKIKCNQVGSINIPIIKQLTREHAYNMLIKEWASKSPDNRTIIAYSMYLPFLKSLSAVKKQYPELIICLVVADLPCQYGILPKNKIRAAIYMLYGQKLMRLTKHIDSFVLLTEQMKRPLHIDNRPYIIVEGISVENSTQNHINTFGYNKKIILYTGTLHYQYGIIDLLDAFDMIKNSAYELWIAGSGEAEIEIKSRANNDNRIKFFGFVTKDRIYKLQSQATILINPRKNEGEYTKYSFPSKTMEYMSSGVPVLMYKLDGIPDDYDNYLYYIKGSSPNEIATRIIDICSKSHDELLNFGLAAKEFVLTQKNSIKAAEKVIEMLKGI